MNSRHTLVAPLMGVSVCSVVARSEDVDVAVFLSFIAVFLKLLFGGMICHLNWSQISSLLVFWLRVTILLLHLLAFCKCFVNNIFSNSKLYLEMMHHLQKNSVSRSITVTTKITRSRDSGIRSRVVAKYDWMVETLKNCLSLLLSAGYYEF